MQSILCEALWARKFLKQLKFYTANSPTDISYDNAAAITIGKDHKITPRSKHFETKYHFIHENIANGNIHLKHIPGSNNLADIFSKPLPKKRFESLVQQLGMTPIPANQAN
jgi:hypothetical protein